jgi:hypothetical protein
LIPGVIIGAQHTYTITDVEPDRAVLQTSGGAMLIHRRRISDERLAVAFWEHPALCAP